MKKLIVTIICVLFVSTSFAQMVGSNSVSKETKPKEKLRVKKHEFSIHGGVGLEEFDDITFFGTMKYKLKPFKKFEIRLLGEVGLAYEPDSYFIPITPILAGINYEGRLSKNWSIFMDVGAGITMPFGNYVEGYSSAKEIEHAYNIEHTLTTYYYDNFDIGVAFSPEIGFCYKKFMFSVKFVYYRTTCRGNTLLERYYDYYNNAYDNFDGNYVDNSKESYEDYFEKNYFLFTLGFRF